MESISSPQREVVLHTLMNIKESIHNLNEWNKNVDDADQWLSSPDGMRTLAADCMLIEAIGEGFKQITSARRASCCRCVLKYLGSR